MTTIDPITTVLRRIQRKGSMPVRDVLAMHRDVLAGDMIVAALQSHGYAQERDGDLILTDAGRRRITCATSSSD